MMVKKFIFFMLFIGLLASCGTTENKEDKSLSQGNSNDYLTEEDEQILSDDTSGMTGYVMRRDADRILVVTQESADYSATGGISEFYSAIWFADVPENIQIGDKVEVWYDIVLTSYPGQSSAIKVAVSDPIQPDGASLTEAEAIQKALDDEQIKNYEIYTFVSSEFNSAENSWTIHLKEAGSGDYDLTIIVNDK